MKKRRHSARSIKRLILLIVSFFMVLLLGLHLYSTLFSIHLIRSQITDNNQTLLQFYVQQIDARLSAIEQLLVRMMSDNYALCNTSLSNSLSDHYLIDCQKVYNTLRDSIGVQADADGLFVVYPRIGKLMDTFSPDTTYPERVAMRTYLSNWLLNVEGVTLSSSWESVSINGQYYLMRVYRTGKAYIGSYIRADHLLIPLNAIRLGQHDFEALVEADTYDPLIPLAQPINLRPYHENENYTLLNNDQYLLIEESSQIGAFRLMLLIDDRALFSGLPQTQHLSIILLCFALALFIFFFSLHYIITKPIQTLTQRISEISEMSIDQRLMIDDRKVPMEFLPIYQTINHMTQHIQTLQNQVVEKERNRAYAQIAQLRIQMKPHFFQNALNTIYSLAEIRQFSTIQQFALALVQYYRYIISLGANPVKLQEELNFVRSYVDIMHIRMGDVFDCDLQCPPELLIFPVPSFIIQTFVENCCKHAISSERKLMIKVFVEVLDESRIRIHIADNGYGFPEDVIQRINQTSYINTINHESGMPTTPSEHFGIFLVKEQLSLRPDQVSGIVLQNDTIVDGIHTGAHVVIDLACN